jgi:hypothetical protein
MIIRNQESIRSLAESPDLVAHMHEVRPGRRLYLTYDLKRAPRHVSKVHGILIAQRQEHQLARSGPQLRRYDLDLDRCTARVRAVYVERSTGENAARSAEVAGGTAADGYSWCDCSDAA